MGGGHVVRRILIREHGAVAADGHGGHQYGDAGKHRIHRQEHDDQQRQRRHQEHAHIRAERRAANPEGITTNTSKKKLTRQQREQEAYEKAAAAKEYAAKRGIVVDEEGTSCMSGIPSRPYCKGRNYDPNRYNSN